jgi:predicted peroxiredoxin
MAEKKKLVIVITRGMDDERSSVAWSVANAGIASEGAAEVARLNPLDPPLKELIGNLMSNGGTVLACPPCAKVRGYSEEDLIDGVTVAGAPAMLEVVKQGAATLSF